MHLRSLVNLSGNNTIILKDDISVGELFSESLPENGYYFVNMLSSFFTQAEHNEVKACSLAALSLEDDEPPETDIVFMFGGRRVHLDFDVILPRTQYVQLTFSRNREGDRHHPFMVEFLYV